MYLAESLTLVWGASQAVSYRGSSARSPNHLGIGCHVVSMDACLANIAFPHLLPHARVLG